MSAVDQRAAQSGVTAFASPTTTRFVVLLGALASAGLFLGNWLHNESPAGTEWQRQVTVVCHVEDIAAPAVASLSRLPEFHRCAAGVERRRAAFTLAGAGIAVLAAVLVMCAAPSVIERRRRLRRAGPKLAPATQRLSMLAAQAGVRAPDLMVGPSTVRDAFSYGLPGRYRVALPPAVAVRARDAATFDPLVRHELAHVARQDVALAWLARSAWLVVVPLLGLPVVWGPLTGDLSLLPSYAWRAALLAVVTLLAADALLRTREHEADLRSARDDESAAQLRGLLARIPPPRRTGWRRLVAYHPSGAQRLAVMNEPARLAAVGFVDGLTAAFLAAIAMPLLVAVLSIPSGALGLTLPALVIGPVLGATVGLGLWRQAFAGKRSGGGARVAPVVLGVFAGSVLGEAASLAQTGLTLTGSDRVASLALSGLAVAGATAVAAGLGELFADARLRSARSAWMACVVLVGALFAVALWAGITLSTGFDQMGWTVVGSALITIFSAWPAAGLALVLAAAATWALLAAPADPSARGRARVLGAVGVGAAAGAVAALVLVGFRLVAGPAADNGEAELRFYAYVWLFAAAGVATAVALAARMRTRGLGVALLASPVASIVAVAGFLVLNTTLGGNLAPAFLESVFRSALALGLLLLLVVAVLAVLPVPRVRAPRLALVTTTAALFAGVLAFGAVAGRHALVPLAQLDRQLTPPTPQASPVPGGTVTTGQSAEALAYTLSYVPDVTRVMDAVESSVASIDQATLTDARRAQRVRLECLTAVQALLADAQTLQPKSTAVQAAHGQLLAALQTTARAFEHFVTAWETGDAGMYQRARTERTVAKQQWQVWQQATANLAAGKTPTVPTRNASGRQTCELFAKLVHGADSLDTAQLRQIVNKMADAAAQSGEPQLLQAVVDLGQGFLGQQPQRFATGIRTLSVLCGVPYR
jgi:hypothetical protein